MYTYEKLIRTLELFLRLLNSVVNFKLSLNIRAAFLSWPFFFFKNSIIATLLIYKIYLHKYLVMLINIHTLAARC
jgi:hypothetical protein